MSDHTDLKDWWTKALLGEQLSAHPVTGRDIQVKVEGDNVTLTGEVRTSDERLQIEREAKTIGPVRSVVNRLQVERELEPQRLQTVIAVFGDHQAAKLAQQIAGSWKLHDHDSPQLLEDTHLARRLLQDLARPAGVSSEEVDRYLEEIRKGKCLLVERIAEDEAFRLISGFEGTEAESIHTLPPEAELPPPGA